MTQIPNYLNQILSATNIALISHKNADTDALASAISLRRFLKDNFEIGNKKLNIDIFTDTHEFSKKDDDLIKNEVINQQTCRQYDLAISLDTANRKLLGCFDKIFRRAKDTLNIDHHATNTKYAKNNIVAPSCSSTCELLYLIFVNSLNARCSANTLSVLYSGIITDTNNLTQNIGPQTYKIIDRLIFYTNQNSIDLDKVRNHYFKSFTREQNALLARALSSLTYSNNGKIAMMKITKQDFTETNTSQSDTLGIVDHAVSTQGVEVGVIFIKQEDNTYYVSLRSKNHEINVGDIAKELGGGGHGQMAAFATKPGDSLTDIKDKIATLFSQQLYKAPTDDISNLFSETQGSGPNKNEADAENTL